MRKPSRKTMAIGVGVALVAAGVALAPTALAKVGSPASPALADRFKAVPTGSTATTLPLGATDATVTVVVQLTGDPVSVTDADTPLSDSQWQSRHDQVKAGQVGPTQSITSLGGTVLGSYQDSYNGLKVSIPASKVSALQDVSGVVAVHPVTLITPANTHGVPLVGAPAAWDGVNGLHGEGVKVGIIDTGIDYTHADFGGPGTAAAYAAAHAAETAPANPSLFGPHAPKVKGGVDLVGDSYNADPASATYQPTPHPDANPLDCNGHGTHVAGTALGFGVLANGSTYTGAYTANTISANSWLVGPGVAPKADLYSIRVFGCDGSADTSVIVDAIEWGVAHHLDVLSMSLGSTWSGDDAPDAVAADNAAKDGVIVVAAAGNDGYEAPYMTGSPANGTSAIAVAAIDPTQTFPGAQLAFSTGATVGAINANGVTTFPSGSPGVFVLPDGAGGIGTGCHLADDGSDVDDVAPYAAQVAGKVLIVERGICARVAKAIFGQEAGAVAVIMVNTDDSYPPFEGPITGNPDPGDGQGVVVTIPFLGVPLSQGAALLATDGATVTISAASLTNPGYLSSASFTSSGPRVGDSWLKPDVAAPGVSISSAGMGTGNQAIIESGTSMATPHTAGVAALVKQADPTWKKVDYYKAALVNTADPGKVTGYQTTLDGAGLVQAQNATKTQVVALGDKGTATLNYGFAELTGDYNQSKTITLHNFGRQAATFTVTVKLSVKASTASEPWIDNFAGVWADVSGEIQFTPTSGSNAGISLRVPYYLVPQTVSNISTNLDTSKLVKGGSATATVTNKKAAAEGEADWYAWGLKDGRDKGLGSTDVANVGVQAFPDDGYLAFAITGVNRWSTVASKEFDVLIDLNGDGNDDWDVFSYDYGLLTAGLPDGLPVTGVLDLTNGTTSLDFFTDAPYDSTTLVLPVLFEQLGPNDQDPDTTAPALTASNPRFSYHVVAYDLTSDISDEVDGVASFNAFHSSVSTGAFDDLAPNKSATETVTYNKTEFAVTPALGFLVISHDNAASSEAQAIPLSNGRTFGPSRGHKSNYGWHRHGPRSGQFN